MFLCSACYRGIRYSMFTFEGSSCFRWIRYPMLLVNAVPVSLGTFFYVIRYAACTFECSFCFSAIHVSLDTIPVSVQPCALWFLQYYWPSSQGILYNINRHCILCETMPANCKQHDIRSQSDRHDFSCSSG